MKVSLSLIALFAALNTVSAAPPNGGGGGGHGNGNGNGNGHGNGNGNNHGHGRGPMVNSVCAVSANCKAQKLMRT